jgi:acetyl-CoA carboxylase alpha subunit
VQNHQFPRFRPAVGLCPSSLMRTYLDFEKPVAELEAKLEELESRRLQGRLGFAIDDELRRLDERARKALANSTRR